MEKRTLLLPIGSFNSTTTGQGSSVECWQLLESGFVRVHLLVPDGAKKTPHTLSVGEDGETILQEIEWVQ